MNRYQVNDASWERDQDALRSIRTQVFVHEQGVSPDEEWDADDAGAWHVLAYEGQVPVGTGRLTRSGKIGRMAVLSAHRNQQVGTLLLQRLLELAAAHRLDAVVLHAQVRAIPFYERAGFAAEGPVFEEAGIAHRLMRRPLVRARQAIDSLEQARTSVDDIAQAAQHALWIYSDALDPLLFDRAPFVAHCRRIGLSGRRAQLQVLVQNPQIAVRTGHRLLHLASRLPTAMQFRTPVDSEDRLYPSAFLLNDVQGYLFRPQAQRHEGWAHAFDPGRHGELLRYFKEVWERSEPHPELRQMSL